MKLELHPNANDTLTPHAILAVNGPMIARSVTIAEGEWIVTACNEYEQLKADQGRHRAELLAVVAKVAAAGLAMDQVAKVQWQLIDALKLARNTITGMGYSSDDIDGTMACINAALNAADGIPP